MVLGSGNCVGERSADHVHLRTRGPDVRSSFLRIFSVFFLCVFSGNLLDSGLRATTRGFRSYVPVRILGRGPLAISGFDSQLGAAGSREFERQAGSFLSAIMCVRKRRANEAEQESAIDAEPLILGSTLVGTETRSGGKQPVMMSSPAASRQANGSEHRASS